MKSAIFYSFSFLLFLPFSIQLGESHIEENEEDDKVSSEFFDAPQNPIHDDNQQESIEIGPIPPEPLDPLPPMSAPMARPPGFGPPPKFKNIGKSGETHEDNVDVGFVVRRGRARVMGFSRRKTD